MLTAYIDESGGSGRELENVYILVASIPLAQDGLSDCRRLLTGLKPDGARKLHWYEADEAKRQEIVELIMGFEIIHIPVESIAAPEVKDERHRRQCMKTLLYQLDQMGVTDAVFESRGSNVRDRKMVKTLKIDGTLSTDFQVTHKDGPFEPLLWVPDAVCGAICERRIGNPTYLTDLSKHIEWTGQESR